MSRSYRHHPVLKDRGQSHKEFKQAANRMARRHQEDLPPKGTHAARAAWAHLYRYEDIVESVRWMSRGDAIRAWQREEHEHVSYKRLHERFGTLQRWLAYWKRHYVSK